ncbi:MAG: cysteine hydrolase [Acidobacteria bacterium]|nr:cysteine hydrolase [Acidobacteriota bacterium]
MQIGTSVLMVVDVQNGFLTEKTRHILQVITNLVDRWQKLNGKTIYTRYFNYEDSAFERLMNWRQLYSPPDTNIADELTSYAEHSLKLDKYAYSAVTPEFTKLLQAHNWTDVVICGIDTDLCVLKTALDAFEHNLTPWVITNASASTGGDHLHKAGMAVLGRAIGEHHLVTAEEFLLNFEQ